MSSLELHSVTELSKGLLINVKFGKT